MGWPALKETSVAPRALVWLRALEERQSRFHVVAAVSVSVRWSLAKPPVRAAESVPTDVGLPRQEESPVEVAQTMSPSGSVPEDSAAAWVYSVLRWLMTDRDGSSWRRT